MRLQVDSALVRSAGVGESLSDGRGILANNSGRHPDELASFAGQERCPTRDPNARRAQHANGRPFKIGRASCRERV